MIALSLGDEACKKMLKQASGRTTLYHISRSGGKPFPKPLLRWQHGYLKIDPFRPWMKESPEKGMWLTPNYHEVIKNHSISSKNIHVFSIDNGLIEKAGGINLYDDALEVIFNEERPKIA
jgi:hypothetical protein